MTPFVFAVHCHQPVGNFPWVLEEAYVKAYRPFLETVEQFPRVRVVFHYSGVLLDWLEAQHPEFLERLGVLVRRGQAEVLSGGYYEPVLSMIPERDAVGQLRKMNETVVRLRLETRNAPEGAWLAERIWEPSLPLLFAQSGIRYTVVDDHHLAAAGIPAERRFGYYLTEDQGVSVALFPSLKKLRYLVPFRPVAEVVAALREYSSEEPHVVVLADDGEKFGLWPGTHKWVYEEGWLKTFFSELERNRDWLECTTFRECLETLPPLGRVNLPCTSYEEMEIWSGGSFRNFLLKYPEVETLYKKMLWISARCTQARSRVRHRSSALLARAQRHLYMGQSNDAYWHGIFGGLYLRHLRQAVYHHLLEAERLLDEMNGKPQWVQEQRLGQNVFQQGELLLRSKRWTLLCDVHRGGQLLELSDKSLGFNLLDTLTRRPEAYHEKLRVASSENFLSGSGSAKTAPSTIHEGSHNVPAEFKELLVYDSYRRAGLMDHFLDPSSQVGAFARSQIEEKGDFLDGAYEAKVEKTKNRLRTILVRRGSVRVGTKKYAVSITKKIEIHSKEGELSVSYRVVNLEKEPLNILFGSEMNMALKDAHVNRIGKAEGIGRFDLVDPDEQIQIQWELDRKAQLWHFPLETISDSEQGMERTYQGVSLTFFWVLTLAPKIPWTVRWTMEVHSLKGSRTFGIAEIRSLRRKFERGTAAKMALS